jgi:hypothetical protein
LALGSGIACTEKGVLKIGLALEAEMLSIALHRRLGRLPLQPASERATLPTLFGAGYGLYRTRGSSFVLSFVGHTLAIAVLLVSSRIVAAHHHEIR